MEIIKIVIIFLIVYYAIGFSTNSHYVREGFGEEGIAELSKIYGEGGGTLNGLRIPQNGIMTGKGKISITSGGDISIESGGKKVYSKGGLGVMGHAISSGDLKVGGNLIIGDNAIEFNADGSAKFGGDVTIRDKYEDDKNAPEISKKKYKSPILLGSLFSLNARGGDAGSNYLSIGTLGDNVHKTSSPMSSNWIVTRSYVHEGKLKK